MVSVGGVCDDVQTVRAVLELTGEREANKESGRSKTDASTWRLSRVVMAKNLDNVAIPVLQVQGFREGS